MAVDIRFRHFDSITMRKEAILPCDVLEEVGGLLGDEVETSPPEVECGVVSPEVAVEALFGASVDCPATNVTT